jgi:Putative zinc-finger
MSFKKPTCKEVAALVVAREDRTLSTLERIRLRTHMWICKACPGFERQILTMRNAMRQWRNYADDSTVAPLDRADR